jgi:lambda family phage minor tail protein L
MVGVINEESQKIQTSEIIELFDLDLTAFGDTTYYFIAGHSDTGSISWNGNVYQPFDVQADGFEYDGKGGAPTPKIRFSVTNPIITVFIAAYKDLIGAKITRTKTYKKFLDGQPTANPFAHFPKDIYRIEQKTSENRLQVEFKLSSILDQRGTQLPRRTITSFYCPWIYRRFNATSGEFVYHPADNACPYIDAASFDVDNNPTDNPALDKCSKTEDGCKARFGVDGVLPFGGFPGSSRTILS